LGACGLGLSRWMLLLLIGCMHRRPGLAPQVQKAPLSLALQLRGKRAYPLGLAGLSSRAARDQSGRCGANLLSGATNHLLVLTMPQKFREPNSTQCMAPAWPSRARFARAMQAEGSQETNHTQCRIAGGGRCSCTAQRGHTFSLFFFEQEGSHIHSCRDWSHVYSVQFDSISTKEQTSGHIPPAIPHFGMSTPRCGTTTGIW
jgi:hypothetical protein